MRARVWSQLLLYQTKLKRPISGFWNVYCLPQTIPRQKFYLLMQIPAMVSAIHEMLPTTKHNYCLWHLRKNLDKNLRGPLRENYNEFMKAWNKCRNSFSENEFQKRWHKLLADYPASRKYLTRTLGPVVTSWALCHTSQSFNAGIQS